MYYKVLQLLNIKPHESKVVRELFTIQFFLGVATAFLLTSSLTMFLSAYNITTLPVAYILSACLLLIFNPLYGYLDEKFSSPKLLGIVILFSAFSILFFWILLAFIPFRQLPLIIAGWYMLIYMLVGYAYWGMASILFNVRESRRLFSIVGAGDIPAKMLGYFSVTALVPLIGVSNLLWVSIISFFVAWYLLKRFTNKGLFTEDDPNAPSHAREHDQEGGALRFLSHLFQNRLVFYIALLSLISYTAFSFIDFTFLSGIKLKYQRDNQIATFIGIFFATGRILAIGIKLLFSSRMISRIGLANSLLVTPLLLLAISAFIIFSGDTFFNHLYVFGFMVLVSEILRSVLQEPVYFVLFQPLKPHDRLRGHLVAKGHTLPFALLAVGAFLLFYLQENQEVPILFVAQLLVALLLGWILVIFAIKKEYLKTLVKSLKKGYFTGAELFLDDSAVTRILLKKTESKKPLEVVHSLHLLERSGYNDIYKLLLKHLQRSVNEIKDYILSRIIAKNMTSALPLIKQQLSETTDNSIKPKLTRAFYYLDKETDLHKQMAAIRLLTMDQQKAAMEGLLDRREENAEQIVIERLMELAKGTIEDKMLVLSIIIDCPCEKYTSLLRTLLNDKDPQVYKQAIEATGKSRNIELLPTALDLAIAHHAYPSFKNAISFYGDAFFTSQILQTTQLPSELLVLIIKAAGNIKGDSSTSFLVDVLTKTGKYFNEIIEALWLKKAVINPESAILIDGNIDKKIDQSQIKVNYYLDLVNNRNCELLQQAIISEIQRDLVVLLKAFALVYDREKVDRVIELLNIGNTVRISNAIEILEIIIPKRFFAKLNNLVELIDDVKHKDVVVTKTNDLRVNVIVGEILKENKANFSEWTRSIACYIVPKLKRNEFSLNVLDENQPKEGYLFNETRNYVLTMLK